MSPPLQLNIYHRLSSLSWGNFVIRISILCKSSCEYISGSFSMEQANNYSSSVIFSYDSSKSSGMAASTQKFTLRVNPRGVPRQYQGTCLCRRQNYFQPPAYLP
eukprot:TRINITY_DN3789_c0_g1_i13.p8 TRINITY_DN3789_c0_g1~~TRINITY_DN3789_c0_g1_i13.p8  ORF type:complete len:104 (+),score=3.11 TRINITY_DN3789_c0_g1_i13:1025-1336(+)